MIRNHTRSADGSYEICVYRNRPKRAGVDAYKAAFSSGSMLFENSFFVFVLFLSGIGVGRFRILRGGGGGVQDLEYCGVGGQG